MKHVISMNGQRRPRVLHIGPLPPPLGGMATHVADFLDSKVAQRVSLRHLRSDLIGKYNTTGLVRTVLNLANCLLLCAVLCWRLLCFRPDIVHIQTGSYGGFFEKMAFILIARLARCKVVLQVHGGGFESFYRHLPALLQRIVRSGLNLNHRVIVLSRELRDMLVEIGVPLERAVVVENAVYLPTSSIWDGEDQQQVGNGGRTTQELTVLFLNRITEEKGVPELIDAACSLRRRLPNVRFRIHGPESPESASMRERAAASTPAGRIELQGSVTGAAKEAAFLAADIFVLPSHVEAMPIALLEAMSFGLPCIVTCVGGVRSVVEHGDNGWLIPAGDSSALATAIEHLATSPALRRRLGINARATIEQHFNWENRAEEIVALYRELLLQQRP